MNDTARYIHESFALYLAKYRRLHIPISNNSPKDSEVCSRNPYTDIDNARQASRFIRNHSIANQSEHYFEDICFRSKQNAFFEKRLNAIDYGYEKNYFNYYFETLRKLFFQIIRTPISKPELTLTTQQYDFVYNTSKNLLNNIIFKQLKQGTIINNYIRSLCLVPLYLTKLFRYDNTTANYILTNDDIFSLDFELAIVGSLPWTTAKNATIMQTKINQWYKNLANRA